MTIQVYVCVQYSRMYVGLWCRAGCMGVWVYVCVGVWVYGCMGV